MQNPSEGPGPLEQPDDKRPQGWGAEPPPPVAAPPVPTLPESVPTLSESADPGLNAPFPDELTAAPSASGEPALPPPLPVRSPRFCGTCGAPWQPHWAECEPCAAVARWAGRSSHAGAPGAAQPGLHGDADDGIVRVRSAIKLYFSLLAVSVVGVIVTAAGAPEVPADLVISTAFSVVVLVWCAVSNPRAVLRLLKPARAVWYPVAVATAGLTLAVAFGVVETLHRVWDVEKLGYSESFRAAGHGTWLVVLVICVQPAIFEELAFRGVMLSGLRPTLSDVEAVFVTALLFMTLNVSPAAFPHTLAMGLAAGFIRLRSGSILPCMLLHMVHNTGVIVAEMYLKV